MTTGSEVRDIVGGKAVSEVGAAQVRQQVDALVERIEAKDLDGLGRLYANDVVSFDENIAFAHGFGRPTGRSCPLPG